MKTNELKNKIKEILGLEIDPNGDDYMFLIRDGNGKLLNGIDFSDEVEQIVSLLSSHTSALIEKLERKLEKAPEEYNTNSVLELSGYQNGLSDAISEVKELNK